MIPRRFSHYEVLDQLGIGGMGEVYRARDLDLGRAVAVKFLPRRYATDPLRLKRFENEARAASSLNHPNIVTIHEIGQAEGLPYIVMELVDGKSLRELLRTRPLVTRRAVEMATQAAEGLAKAHEAGIVHRDLKPENLMVTADGFVKILDFGLAKLREPDVEAAEAVFTETTADSDLGQDGVGTSPGAILGTTGYMSPEQASGSPVDYRSDQFSCGSVLYEMATGRRAFQRLTSAETRAAIIREEPQPISELNPDVPVPFRWIVQRCLAKDPQDRYASTMDLAHDLKDVRDHFDEATPSKSDPGVLHQPSWRRRRLARRIAAAAAGVALAILAARYLPDILPRDGRLPLPEMKHVAVLPLESTSRDPSDEAFSRGLAETLTSHLTQLEPPGGALWLVPFSEVRRAGVTSPTAARGAFGVNLALTGSVQRSGDTVRVTVNLVDAVELVQLRAEILDRGTAELAALQDVVVERVAAMLGMELASPQRERIKLSATSVAGAYELYVKGRGYLLNYQKPENLDLAIGFFQRALEQDPDYALAYAGLGEAHWQRYRLTKRPESVELARQNCQRALELNDLLAPVHVTLGIIHRGTGEHEEAVKAFAKARELDPRNADAFRGLAGTYQAQGRLEEAEATYREAIALRPDYWAAYNDSAGFYRRQARYSEAEPMFRKALELAPENSLLHSNLGALYHLMGRYTEAAAQYREASALRPSYRALANLGALEFFLGRYPEAARSYEHALRIDDTDHRVWRNLGWAYYWAPGERDKATGPAQRAVEMLERELEVNARDPDLVWRLADCYSLLGDADNAREYAARVLELAPATAELWFRLAQLHEHLGDREEALRWIQKALAGGYSIDEIERAPELSRLREDPRFLALG